jgi:hypothetical protein
MLRVLILASLCTGQQPDNWPKHLIFPPGLTRYQSARFTQRIAVVNNRDDIRRVDRRLLEEHWQVPGGLEQAPKGWQSTLYRHLPTNPLVWIGNIAVWNGANFQDNRGFKRAYPDGTLFADVLSNKEGQIFEIRYREREGGLWYNYIAYRDRKARSPGFFEIKTRQCNSCHSQAGSGGYAVGLVPGGDGVLSDPFPGLER